MKIYIAKNEYILRKQAHYRSVHRLGFPFAIILSRTVLLCDHLSPGWRRPSLPRAEFSQLSGWKSICSTNGMQIKTSCPLLAECHIQLSPFSR
jgi:hypothetical protein